PPDRPLPMQQPVVLKEGEKILSWEVEHLLEGRRPYGGTHRQQVVLYERGSVSMPRQIGSERTTPDPASGAIGARCAIEALHVPQHPKERQRDEIGALRKDTVEGFQQRLTASGPLEATAVGGDRKTHVASDGINAEMREERGQLGVVR